MSGLARLWAEGGWPMYPLVLLALVAIPATLALVLLGLLGAEARMGKVGAVILAALGLGALAIGVGGERLAMRNVDEAIVHVHPADKELIRHAGQAEALVPLIFGLIVAVLPLAGAAVLGVRQAFSGPPAGPRTGTPPGPPGTLRPAQRGGIPPALAAGLLILFAGFLAVRHFAALRTDHQAQVLLRYGDGGE